jgi:hypothetical protein
MKAALAGAQLAPRSLQRPLLLLQLRLPRLQLSNLRLQVMAGGRQDVAAGPRRKESLVASVAEGCSKIV